MNLFRVMTLSLLLTWLLVACSGKGNPSSGQAKADDAAKTIADAINQSNTAVETDDQVSTINDGKLFKADLLDAINRADKIIITEHSNENDYYDPDAKMQYQGPFAQYGKVELSVKQKADFSAIISGLSNDTQDTFSACIFDPHHSIQFHSSGKLSSTMEICFMCDQVEWKGSPNIPPGSIYSGLSQFVVNVGLSPERDWRKLVKAHKNK
jgi:hypothetical protein